MLGGLLAGHSQQQLNNTPPSHRRARALLDPPNLAPKGRPFQSWLKSPGKALNLPHWQP
jgi:hypothetical protein